MSIRSDRDWMYKRSDDGYLSSIYHASVKGFLDVAFANEETVDGDRIRCPCSKCKNRHYRTRDDVELHLLKNGFIPNYTTWWAHGERNTIFQHEGQSSNPMQDPDPMEDDDDVDGCTRMVMDVMEDDVDGYDDILEDADEPLWDGCENYSKLQAASELLNWKSEYNISEAAYDHILPMIKRMLPKSEKLVENFYETKKMLKSIRLPEIKIHVCKNQCMIFYGEDSDLTKCRYCNHDRYKSGRRSLIPYAVMRHLPFAPRLQRLYLTKKTAKHMTWHHDHRTEPGLMVHPSDGEAWKHFDMMHPEFASEPRNVRLGLCTDGFSPNNSNSSPHSCWPVFLSVYNLPPWMCLKEPYVQLSIVIPGKKSPGQNLDVFLRPLIDELKMMYTDGVVTYDASRKCSFTMKAMLLWTVSDFPAYAMLSGWSTHGKLACPYCMGESGSFQLHHGGKPCWFDGHRRFLSREHRYRGDKTSFLANKVERSGPPPTLTGDQIWEQVRDLPTVYEGKPYKAKNKKLPGFGDTHNWVKRSIFWELPYWRTLLIRHNLDVMHIEKNVFDNIFNTVMDTPKSKDNIKARKDIEMYCNRVEWHTWKRGNKDMKHRASFALSKEQVIKICQWLINLKFPDGYASNLGGCVNVEDNSFYNFKSHECHVFMQRLLPIALRGMIPNSTWDAITELCTFFRAICSRVLRVNDLLHLQTNIVETICKLEKIFPPGFFDSMEHLVIHLAREAMLGGPVQYRWMYLYERKLGSLKRKIKNHARVEGSIVEAYIIGEISTFCSQYFSPTIDTRLNRESRNFAPDIPSYTTIDSRLSIFKVPSRRLFEKSGQRRLLSDDEMRIAHNYILINCVEVLPFLRIFENHTRRRQPDMDDGAFEKFRDQHFAKWLRDHVSQESNNISQHLKGLARGPLRDARSYKGYFVNGYKFHTEKHGNGRVTHNSGVCVRGTCYNESECDYYGLLKEVLEVEYQGIGRCVVVLFNCTWFDPTQGVKVDPKHNLVDIKYKSRLRNDDPFILASQAEQVYYAPYPSMKDLKDWWAVVKTKPRGVYELRQCLSGEDDNEDDEEQFFQESETSIPSTSSSANEVDEPVCLVIEGEIEEVNNDDTDDIHIEVNEEEEELDDNSDDSDEDSEDEVDIWDGYSDDE